MCAGSGNDGKQSLSLCSGGIGNVLVSTWNDSCPRIFFFFFSLNFTEMFTDAKVVLIHTCYPSIIIQSTLSGIVSWFT